MVGQRCGVHRQVITRCGRGAGAAALALPLALGPQVALGPHVTPATSAAGNYFLAGTVQVGRNPADLAVSPDGRRIYVANQGSDTVSVITAAAKRITATIPVGKDPVGVAVSPNGRRIYVTNSGSGTVSVITAAAERVTATFPAGTDPTGMAVSPDGTRLYVANHDRDTVSVICIAAHRVIATIRVASQPQYVAVSPDGTRVYVVIANIEGTIPVKLVEISTAANRVIHSIDTDTEYGAGLAVSPDGTHAYVATESGLGLFRLVVVVDLTTNRVTADIGQGEGPGGIAVSPDGAHVYTAHEGPATFVVIGTSSKGITDTVTLGPEDAEPGSVAASPSGTYIYVSSPGGDTVWVIAHRCKPYCAGLPSATTSASAADGSRSRVAVMS